MRSGPGWRRFLTLLFAIVAGAPVGRRYVVSGILIGILLSRTISGLVADAFGWRALYMAAAVLMVILAAVLARVLPTTPSPASVG